MCVLGKPIKKIGTSLASGFACSIKRARYSVLSCRVSGTLIWTRLHRYPCLFLTAFDASCPQLPVYVPSEAEKKDPALYASNVRDMMLRVGGFKASPASLQDSRAYIALLQARCIGPTSSVASLATLRVSHSSFALCTPAVLHVDMQTCSHCLKPAQTILNAISNYEKDTGLFALANARLLVAGQKAAKGEPRCHGAGGRLA